MLRPRLWKCIERLPGLSAPRLGWSAVLGEELQLVDKYLRPTNRLAETIPCVKGCTPGCRRNVICHGPNDYVAVCPEGSVKYAVSHADLIVQELDVPAFGQMLCKALALDGIIEPAHDLHHTWLMGYYPARSGIVHPVYLMIQQDPALMQMAAMHLCLGSGAPFAVFVPTASMLNDSIGRAIDTRQSVLLPLDKTMHWSPDGQLRTELNLADVFARGPRERLASGDLVQQPPRDGQVLLERRDMSDGIHWIVGGEDKGVFFKRKDSIKAKIIEILFDQIGNGYVPHKTFINSCGWTEKHYFGEGSEAKVIQKHLTDIRNFLGIEVAFRIQSGVRFGENIVKSRK